MNAVQHNVISQICSVRLVKPTVFIDTRTDTNKIFIARWDWDERKVHITYVGKFRHAANTLQVAYAHIKPINGTEEIYVLTTKRTRTKRKLKVMQITQFEFIKDLQWDDERYGEWNSIFETFEYSRMESEED